MNTTNKSILGAAFVLAAIADPTPPPSGIAWEPSAEVQGVTNYSIYYSVSKESSAPWIKLVDVSPTSMTNIGGTNLVIFRFRPGDPHRAWARFVATAHNAYGESDYSRAVIMRPDSPDKVDKVQ